MAALFDDLNRFLISVRANLHETFTVYCAQTTASRDDKHLSFEITCVLYFTVSQVEAQL